MKVYIVLFDDGGSAWISSVHANKEDADREAKGDFCYEVHEFEVRGTP